MNGPRPIGRSVPEVAGKALGKRGLAFGALITDWASIVGPQLSLRAVPDRLAFPRGKREDATLHLRTAGAFALELQHLAPLIVERINGFFGYRAVSRIKLVHGVLPAPAAAAPRLRSLSAAEEQAVAAATDAVADDDLRESLQRFGRAMLARRGGRTPSR